MKTEKWQCLGHDLEHDWEAVPPWGVFIGFSKCKRCGKVARAEDFPRGTQRERPIIFSGPMVRAIREDRKSQTRRVLMPQPIDYDPDVDMFTMSTQVYAERGWMEKHCCPYGIPGDLLWVRESWAVEATHDHTKPRDVVAKGIWYMADGEPLPKPFIGGVAGKWRPSIFMPRWASRITLEIARVRIQQVRDITPEDAAAEGVQLDLPNAPIAVYYGRIGKFHELWDSINAKRGYGWNVNPWVRVIEFNRRRP